jgi:ABC-type uncharacterized transport system substrate-binding protein
VSRRLDEVPGIGPALATALVASIADPKAFRSGRDFSAWIGLVPKQNSSGGKDALMSFGPDYADQNRHGAAYVDRLLRGAKVSELPVQFPTKYKLIINFNTAKALGLTVPLQLLARADEVIE